MLRFVDAANAVTLLALLLAAASVCLAIRELPAFAMLALSGAGLCDLFDGLIARRLRRTAEQGTFGARLDSLVDACAFGLAPPALLYAVGLTSLVDCLLLAMYLACAVWRLAYFDTVGVQSEGNARYYVGLPTTYVALVLPLAFLSTFAGFVWFQNTARVTLLVLALAMVSSVKIRKPSGIAYGFFLLLALVVGAILVVYAPLLHDHMPK